MATALQADQAVITEDGFRYVDNEHDEEKIVPFNEVIPLPEDDAEDDEPSEENNSEEKND